MNTLHETDIFADWLEKLKDHKGRARIFARLRSAKAGNFGDCKPAGEGVSEMRIDFGPGYRVYYAQEGLNVYLLIVGGDKSSQARDIKLAKAMWREIKEKGL
ncbi:conserved hypothetical protein [uncultured delta proteobacterium]|uniref:Addiction module killer protein n=1 Tax=uncultured delta proteobacterium TaxID=34034 RepID=A0A212K7H9_9DELT|nr:conserved hypothetical protein [uncultured delta proteobacterium]